MASLADSMILLIRTPKEYCLEGGRSLKLTTASPLNSYVIHQPMNKETRKLQH